VVQLVGLLVLATAGAAHPRILPVVYLPLIVVSALAAALRMDNLRAGAVSRPRQGLRDLAEVARQPHSWVLCALYTGTFGSFIGFGFAFGQVLQVQFADRFDTPVKAAYLTFLGPLLGSLTRPVGGRLADRFGGARVTLGTFAAMAAGTVVVLMGSRAASLTLFLAGFVALFLLSGIGNGSTYKMIPAVQQARARRSARSFGPGAGAVTQTPRAVEENARRGTGALIGLAGAVGAFGGVLVDVAFRQSFLTSGSGDAAYGAFLAAYAVCAALTWAVYVRRGGTARA
jgi:NNP family nitrate/nitrite transporter-like MFS transporter